MLKTILVPIAGQDSDRTVLTMAKLIAERFRSHLHILHVSPDPVQVVTMAALGDAGSGIVMGDLIDRFEKDAKEALKKARTQFTTFLAETGISRRDRPPAQGKVSAAWSEAKGDLSEHVVHLGRCHDLILLSRRGNAVWLGTDTIETTLMESGRPLLIAEGEAPKAPGRAVAIAWKDTAEAARSITAAMPVLEKAEAVTVIHIREGEKGEPGSSSSSIERVIEQLAWNGIAANGKTISAGERNGPDAFLAAAHDANADLVVMGGYGHGRVRELVFGGFTRYMLRNSDLPVLMFH